MLDNSNNKLIVKNTLLLYVRMFLIMAVSLYTSRVILQGLGVEDFGIYNAVGGFIAMFAIISNSLSVAISRFITYELGKVGNNSNLIKIFSTSVIIQLMLALLIVVAAETIGLWFLNTKMNIPVERQNAAFWVFQFSILTFIVNLLSVPYNACIIAHEKMAVFAYISILDAGGKLLIAYLLIVSPVDRLIFYVVLIFMMSLLIRSVYGYYCKRNFLECNFSWYIDAKVFKKIFSFAGWNFIGASSGILRDQGINVLLNIFTGPVVNAARGISMQINNAVIGFSNNFMTAINPQITKSYACGEKKYLMQLVNQGAKYSYCLLLIVSLPLLIETPTVLRIWLGVVPDYTINFVRLILIYSLIESMSYTLITLMLATGNIRNYQIIVGGCQMLNFPVAYLFLKNDFPPEMTVVGSIIIACFSLITRLVMLRNMVHFSIKRFLIDVIWRVFVISILSTIVPVVIVYVMKETILRFFILGIFSFLSTGLIVYFVGCSNNERAFVKNKVLKFLKR